MSTSAVPTRLYDSVTRALYERGWRGVNIEAQPARLEAFERDRPEDTNLSMAIGDEDGGGRLRLLDEPRLGFAARLRRHGKRRTGSSELLTVRCGGWTVFARTSALEHVDVLKIDVEGRRSWLSCAGCSTVTSDRWCAWLRASHRSGRRAGDEAVALLVDAGYLHCMFDGLNDYLTTDESLREALSYPANPVDGLRSGAESSDLLARAREPCSRRSRRWRGERSPASGWSRRRSNPGRRRSAETRPRRAHGPRGTGAAPRVEDGIAADGTSWFPRSAKLTPGDVREAPRLGTAESLRRGCGAPLPWILQLVLGQISPRGRNRRDVPRDPRQSVRSRTGCWRERIGKG